MPKEPPPLFIPRKPLPPGVVPKKVSEHVENIYGLACASFFLGVVLAPVGVILATLALTRIHLAEEHYRTLRSAELRSKLAEAKKCALLGLAVGIFISIFSVTLLNNRVGNTSHRHQKVRQLQNR